MGNLPRLRSVAWLAAGACALAAALFVLRPESSGGRAGATAVATDSDYGRELAEYDRRLAQLPAAAGDARRAELRYRRALLAGDSATLSELAATLSAPGRRDSVLALRADLALHHLSGALHRLPALAADADPAALELLRAQILAQGSSYDVAVAAYTRILERNPSWEARAGLAGLMAVYGHADRADALYEQAADDLDVRQMRAFCWVLLQRGWLQLRQGRVEAALRFYAQAERAYGGYWLVDDHIAEALAAAGRFDAAIARYHAALAKVERPELQQALGDLYQYLGRTDEAAPWLDRAGATYSRSVERGETHYLHHLARYYTDSRADPPKAIALARRDLQLRPVPAAYDMLAWALYRGGQFDAAHEAIEQALATGVRDADIDTHAAMIQLALGHADAGARWLREAAAVNPRNGAFHVHR